MLSEKTTDVLQDLSNLSSLMCHYQFKRLSPPGAQIPVVGDIIGYYTGIFYYLYLALTYLLKGELLSQFEIDFKSALQELGYQNLTSPPTTAEFNELRQEIHHCGYGQIATYDACENFIKYLKQHGKKRQLLTLIKLGADKNDCLFPVEPTALLEQAENICAKSNLKRGRDSLQWLSAKAVNKHRISTQEATESAQDLVNAANTFDILESKPEVKPHKRRCVTPFISIL